MEDDIYIPSQKRFYLIDPITSREILHLLNQTRDITMFFKSTTILLTVAMTSLLVAAADNSIIQPSWGQVFNVGEDAIIRWTPTTAGPVNLILRRGGASDLAVVSTIAYKAHNSGEYIWSLDSKLKTNTDYSIEIQDANNVQNSNFSPYFTILAIGQGITSVGDAPAASASTDVVNLKEASVTTKSTNATATGSVITTTLVHHHHSSSESSLNATSAGTASRNLTAHFATTTVHTSGSSSATSSSSSESSSTAEASSTQASNEAPAVVACTGLKSMLVAVLLLGLSAVGL